MFNMDAPSDHDLALPPEMWCAVSSHMCDQALLRAARVCRAWRAEIVKSPRYHAALAAAIRKHCGPGVDAAWSMLVHAYHPAVPFISDYTKWLTGNPHKALFHADTFAPQHLQPMLQYYSRRSRVDRDLLNASLLVRAVHQQMDALTSALYSFGITGQGHTEHCMRLFKYGERPIGGHWQTTYTVAEIIIGIGSAQARALAFEHTLDQCGPRTMDCAAISGLEACQHARAACNAPVTPAALLWFVETRNAEGVEWACRELQPDQAICREALMLCLKPVSLILRADELPPRMLAVLAQLVAWCPAECCAEIARSSARRGEYLARAGFAMAE